MTQRVSSADGLMFNGKKEEAMPHTQRRFYTVSRKNVFVWLAALLALLALACFSLRVHAGLNQGCRGSRLPWFQGILPALAALFFAWQLLMHGQDRSYRLALPFGLLCVDIALLASPRIPLYGGILLSIALAVCAGMICGALAGELRPLWMICPIAAFWTGVSVWLQPVFPAGGRSLPELLNSVAEPLLLGAYLPLCFAMRQVKDGKYHPSWGDRSDGRRIRSLDPISAVGAYVMPERNQADVFFHDQLEITALEAYIRKKRVEGYESFGVTEALLAAYVRTVSKYPAINRFIAGSKVYSRGEDIQFCMVVKKEMRTDAPETVVKVHLRPGDSMPEVYRKFHAAVEDARKSMELDSTLDGAAAFFSMIPGVLLKFTVWLLKLLDYFGLLPRWLLELSPFHGSIFFTSMASLGIPAVFHHLYNFGNLPIFLAFGRKSRVNELQEDGSVVTRKYIDYSMNVDERIVDGFYYATAVKYFHKLMLHPERLDEPEMEVNEDIP